jgi:hypothetical protein
LTDAVKSGSFITAMTSRRQRRGQKKTAAVGDFISRQARDLKMLAVILNGQAWKGSADIVRDATAVVEASTELPYPFVSRKTGQLFLALAGDVPFRYVVDEMQPQAHTPAVLRDAGAVFVFLQASSIRGLAARELEQYFRNPARDRLRRCQQCARWFVDETRNKSALRCSRACTIAWSNSQRDKTGARR